ncbi:YuzF family protein [Alkalihalobacillus pseudalcaliphilus]|uniref:YuzF family protein n=1 Tax=Alkalihalobacillus pseudalcaliphilus TaxID=79884 RepID=UPI00064D8EF6|nr:YuzF family protein [Alkalihalobacillus pseudalcaliphilus]KMK75960.1 hypothetical protein AB990_11980 [Alkalihalobacillus pseudalcaliphilus]
MSSELDWRLSDPYVYQNLSNLENSTIGVQTTQGSVRGQLTHVYPDHIIVEMGDTPFYIRTQEIIWFFPVKKS